MALNLPLPYALGAATCLPAWDLSQAHQSGHQLPGSSWAPASQSSWDLGSLPSARTQLLRFFFSGGLITPAMCPEAPMTNRFLLGITWVLAYAPPMGTMWSSRE